MRRVIMLVLAVAVAVPLAVLAQGLASVNNAQATTQTQSVERSFDEFLAVQGTFCVPDGSGGCVLFFSPLPNMLGWENANAFSDRCALVDYAGLANEYIKQQSDGATDLGTQVTGTVTERALADGGAEITVRLRFTDALAFAVEGCDVRSGPLVFGYRAQEVLAGATPSLADGSLVFKYEVPAPGYPLQDLIQVVFFPSVGQNLVSVRFHADSDGQLRAASGFPDGTTGTLSIDEVGFFKQDQLSDAPLVVHRIEVKPQ